MRLVRWIGRFHPVVIHFPIALILAACAAELLGWLSRSRRLLDAARMALGAGALGAVVAAAVGWAAWLFASFPGDMAPVLSTHRWLGTAAAILSVIAAGAAVTGGEWESPRHRFIYRLLLIATGLLIGATGHWGGTLIYGADHYTW